MRIHAVIANLTKMPDGKWQALHNVEIWKNNSVLGSIYNAALRTGLEKLGYQTELTGKHGQFEIKGVSSQVIEAFSTRSAEIEAKDLGQSRTMIMPGQRLSIARMIEAMTAVAGPEPAKRSGMQRRPHWVRAVSQRLIQRFRSLLTSTGSKPKVLRGSSSSRKASGSAFPVRTAGSIQLLVGSII